MAKSWNSMMRKVASIASAGLLLQTGGCDFNLTETIQQIAILAASDLVTSAVFGAFNLPTGGGFGF